MAPTHAIDGHAAFLRAIRADPGDPMPRLVYADWLDERGDPDGEVVRLLCEVQRPAFCRSCWGGTRAMAGSCAVCGGTGEAPPYSDTPAWRRLRTVTGGLGAVIDDLFELDRRLLACDCAERMLPLFEREHPGDNRPRQAIETARRYVHGQATRQDLDAAEDAAWAAATDAESARAAAWVAESARAAAWVAGAAAWVAGGIAPDPAAERRWQLCRAVEYRLGFVLIRERGSDGTLYCRACGRE